MLVVSQKATGAYSAVPKKYNSIQGWKIQVEVCQKCCYANNQLEFLSSGLRSLNSPSVHSWADSPWRAAAVRWQSRAATGAAGRRSGPATTAPTSTGPPPPSAPSVARQGPCSASRTSEPSLPVRSVVIVVVVSFSPPPPRSGSSLRSSEDRSFRGGVKLCSSLQAEKVRSPENEGKAGEVGKNLLEKWSCPSCTYHNWPRSKTCVQVLSAFVCMGSSTLGGMELFG